MSGMRSTLNILIVHNDVSVYKHISGQLALAGYEQIACVDTVRDGLSVLKTQSVDVLICGADLSELDGWRLSRLVRSGALKCEATIPIMLVTVTWCERIAEVTAREHGINDLVCLDDLPYLSERLDECLKTPLILQKPNLLVVEDDPDTSEIIKRVLSYRFKIDVADDGQKGLECWLEKRHDLVLLDVMLPIMSGPEVLGKILEHHATQPVVIMTAHATVDQAEKLLIDGAADFIPKPFRPEPLRAVTEVALRRDDYLVSNQQFATRVKKLAERENAYQTVSQRHEHILDTIQTVVMELDQSLNITFLNKAWENLMGYSCEESLGSPLRAFFSIKDGRKNRAVTSRIKSVLSGSIPRCELQVGLEDKAGKQHWVELRISRAKDSLRASTVTVCMNDVTKRKFAQEQLEYLAMHDSLTALYNRHYFENTLERWSIEAQSHPQLHGLVYIDLDFFKVINDTFGHHKGDEVLRDVSELIKNCIRGSDILCRIGGDEFAVLLYDIQLAYVERIASEIQESIGSYTFQVGNERVDLGCSVGVSLVDGSSHSAEQYLQKADIALYVAKRRGRNMVHFFDPSDGESEELRTTIDWSRQIRQAITDDRLELYIQPVYDIENQRVSYYELLIRMIDLDGKLIMPGEFISALENTGDIVMLDRLVVQRAMEMLNATPNLGKVSINLSAQTFKDDSLVPIIRETLNTERISPSAIIFELTESASLFNIAATRRVIDQLHELGCSFAIDDFGSGFSSFAYLKELPADYIKLDGSFIRNLHKDKVDQALVRSIIEVVKSLGSKTVAEFVENESILKFLVENGVDYAQGYHIGRPVPVSSLNLSYCNEVTV